MDSTAFFVGIGSKVAASTYAASKRVVKSVSSPFLSSSSAPSINAKIVKLQECPEIFDMTPREAQFAIRATDLGSWKSSSRSGEEPTDSDPKTIQHWALVVYFQRGEIINLFEAWNDDGQLQAGRAQIAFKDIAVFNKADYIGTAVTSPYQLLEIAKQVYTGEYSALLGNNCQSWLKEFLDRVYSACESSLILPEKYKVKNVCHDLVSCIRPQPKSVPYEI